MTTTELIQIPEEIQKSFNGKFLFPGDEGYDAARSLHNGMIDKRPAVIACCVTTADVRDAVNLGRDLGLEISVRGCGHNVAGRAVTEGGLMIDVNPMKGVSVDPAAMTITAQPGVNWGQINRASSVHGMATPGGVVSTTGIAGLTLGGGLGWLQGRYGLASDNLIGAELVTAEGDVLIVNEDTNPDLLWALRGAGANFGVVTSLKYRAYPVTDIVGGMILHPYDDAAAVFDAYGRFIEPAPDELALQFGLMHDQDGVKLAALVLCHSGDNLDDAELEVAPIREYGSPVLDDVKKMAYPGINTLFDPSFPRGAQNYWKSAFLRELSPEVAKIMVDAYATVPSPLTLMLIEPVRGAAARVDPTATAYPHRQHGYSVLIQAQWWDPAESEVNIAWTREVFDALRPYMLEASYVNYLSEDDGALTRDAYGPNVGRLRELKRQYDPTNLFHLNHNIDPAG
ncbi:FAD-binding oxidoreductase [Rhodococcus jostii]|uniref:FAD/FMN-containing dehydrogenase n=1 Tax=Rhodococcus jostii TaxID=132919 RepID=A0A1H4IT42_RHOJO|nr:FAD-binding oxidoreductase [Rhodococcus jostii]SEB36816.1 FAD/FMN-containing dehydrogenase [Rhodococcus jostii]